MMMMMVVVVVMIFPTQTLAHIYMFKHTTRIYTLHIRYVVLAQKSWRYAKTAGYRLPLSWMTLGLPTSYDPQGRKLAVVGANGCGKSTLLSYFSGREQPKEGQIRLQPDVHITVVERLG
jgi:ABC-type sulfate/molybdate transport systems ATPase subunit